MNLPAGGGSMHRLPQPELQHFCFSGQSVSAEQVLLQRLDFCLSTPGHVPGFTSSAHAVLLHVNELFLHVQTPHPSLYA